MTEEEKKEVEIWRFRVWWLFYYIGTITLLCLFFKEFFNLE